MDRRIIVLKRKYVVIGFLAVIARPVNVQFAMPMFPMGPPMFPMPSPIQLSVMPMNIPSPPKKTTTTTSEKPEEKDNNNIAVAIPVPMPMPVQIAVPAQAPPFFCAGRNRPPHCPPCPPCICLPSCTPAFFSYCSPCHQKCRCTNGNEAPVPLPPVAPMPVPGPAYPMPMPFMPPAIVVPIPPNPRIPHNPSSGTDNSCNSEGSSSGSSGSSGSSSSGSSDDSSSSDDGYMRARKRGKRGKRPHRKLRKLSKRKLRMSRRNMDNDENVIKPVLSFINRDGDVKLKQTLSEDDVRELMREGNPEAMGYDEKGTVVQNVRLITGEDAQKKPQIMVVSEFGKKEGIVNEGNGFTRSKRVMMQKEGNKILQNGRKQLIFKPPSDKTISNLSVSFQVS